MNNKKIEYLYNKCVLFFRSGVASENSGKNLMKYVTNLSF